ncbi:hypothetical protein SLS62_002338 [Diatrype stigma]|uniref:Thioesterase domain-containing protein n=1 Tax=Diatrype stigma TaxID=117547 RepID=A0AAN9UXK6_9PEZI
MGNPPGDKLQLPNKAEKGARVQHMKELEPGIDRVRIYLDRYTESQKDPKKHDWTSAILPHLTILSHSASPPQPQITFRFAVQPAHCNGLGNLHGGCAATVFDLCTSLPLGLVARPGYWQWLGVSRTLSVTYLRPVPAGSVVRVECELLQVGRRLCSARGVMRLVVEGEGAGAGEDVGGDGEEQGKGKGKGKLGPVLAICEHGKVNTDPPAEKL